VSVLLNMKIYIPQKNKFAKFEVIEKNGILEISDGKRTNLVDLKQLGNNHFSLIIDNQSSLIEARPSDGEIRVVINQHEYIVPVLSERRKIEAEVLGDTESVDAKGEILAPMPGLILKIEVEEGQAIQPGQPLVIMEAMKMENEIRSQIEGKIQEVLIKENQKVEKNDLLLKIHQL
jgi:biotin carboxyl carrier protein